MSSNEYFSVSFEVGDDIAAASFEREEFLPATRGTYLVWVKHYHIIHLIFDQSVSPINFSRFISNKNTTYAIYKCVHLNNTAFKDWLHAHNCYFTSYMTYESFYCNETRKMHTISAFVTSLFCYPIFVILHSIVDLGG